MDFGLLCVSVSSSIVNKYTSPMGDVDNRGGYTGVGAGSKWKIRKLPFTSIFVVDLSLL